MGLPVGRVYRVLRSCGSTALPNEIANTTWGRLLAESEPVHALVAEIDDALVGVAHYIFHRSTIRLGNTCYLQGLYTAPEARGVGVGRALIEGVYRAARAAGAPQVYWHTQESNAGARALYDKLALDSGFVVYRKALAT